MERNENESNQAKEGIISKAWHEVSRPFIDLVHAPRALWGVNLAYTLEGLSYFGILTYLAIHFSDFVFRGVEHADVWSHQMVMILTAGISISMVLLGWVPDKYGVRKALILAFSLLLVGRVIMSSAPTILGLQPNGLWSSLHVVTMFGILLITIGYGMYQPAAYAAVRQFTTPKTASMGYAMLYALMNAGSALAMLAFVFRDEEFLGLGIVGTFWVYTGLTLISLIVTITILSKQTVENAIRTAKEDSGEFLKPETKDLSNYEAVSALSKKVPITAWIVWVVALLIIYFKVGDPYRYVLLILIVLMPVSIAILPSQTKSKVISKIASHPLADLKFFIFIFALIPVQTLFTYNWLVLPQYISRAYEGWIGKYYEIASNMNPVLIFILVPMITALTYKRNVYNMILLGTFVMASSAFILAFGATPITLFGYIIVMTIGEAIWSARFLQYATEIAPEGRAGQYQGVAQLPWFLTKFLVPLLYSGQMMERYCPANGPKNTETMWLIFGLIATATPVLLWLLRSWMLKDGRKH